MELMVSHWGLEEYGGPKLFMKSFLKLLMARTNELMVASSTKTMSMLVSDTHLIPSSEYPDIQEVHWLSESMQVLQNAVAKQALQFPVSSPFTTSIKYPSEHPVQTPSDTQLVHILLHFEHRSLFK